jgi:hypothetical protein
LLQKVVTEAYKLFASIVRPTVDHLSVDILDAYVFETMEQVDLAAIVGHTALIQRFHNQLVF